MADNPRDKKKMQTVRDWINRLPEKSRALEFEQRRKLWEALRAYLHSHGGSVTGLPGTKHLRAEVPRGSSLPAKLMEFGYDVRHSGTGTSLTSGTTDARCLPVDVIDISLSGK
jgi:hypothetical protein